MTKYYYFWEHAGTLRYYAQPNNTDGVRQILCDFTHMWKINKTDKQFKTRTIFYIVKTNREIPEWKEKDMWVN